MIDLDKSDFSPAELRQIDSEVAEALGLEVAKYVSMDPPDIVLSLENGPIATTFFVPTRQDTDIVTILDALPNDTDVTFSRDDEAMYAVVCEYHDGIGETLSYHAGAPTRPLALSLAVCKWGRAKGEK